MMLNQIIKISILFLLSSPLAFADNGVSAKNKDALQRIEPVGQINIAEPTTTTASASAPTNEAPAQISPEVPAQTTTEAAPAATKVSAPTGETIYDQTCKTCHATGLAGAPKFGDTEAWKARAAKGMPQLLMHAEKGFNAMPPKGTCIDCSNEDLQEAIIYMLKQANVEVPKEND